MTPGAARGYDSMRMRLLAVVLAAVAGAADGSPPLPLYGVPFDGATDPRSERGAAVIDARGDDVHGGSKDAPVRVAAAGEPIAGAALATAVASATPGTAADGAEARPTRRYFLSSAPSRPEGASYDVAVFVNGAWIREIRASEPQAVVELTRFLHRGPNEIVFAATKRPDLERPAPSREATLRLAVGEGKAAGDGVALDAPLVESTRSALETDDRTEAFVLAVQ